MANKRLLDFPALASPNGSSLIYIGNQADSFRESKVTIDQFFTAYSPALVSIAGLTTAADKMIYTTASNTYAVADLTATARTLLADASAAAMLATLGAVPLAGGTMTGLLTLSGDASNALNPVSLQQLQAAIQNTHSACLAASSGADSLSTWTYNNGTAGVGATLTAPANGSQAFDGVTPVDGDSILVIDQDSNLPWQGAYTIVQGTGGTPAVLTRRADFDQASEMQSGDAFRVVSGTNLGGHTFMFTQTAAITVGTTDLTFNDITDSGALLKSNNLSDLTDTSAAIANLGAAPNPNIIIGGNFTTNPWQRGTTFTSTANETYTADRFAYGQIGGTLVVDCKKTADAPTLAQAGFYTEHCLEMDVTTADAAVAAGDLSVLRYQLEGYDSAQLGFGQSGAGNVTLSFWHKHTKTGTFCVALVNNAIDRSYVKEYTQSVSDTWEKATLTFPVDTSGTWLSTNGIGLRIYFTAMAGSDFQGAVDTWNGAFDVATSNQVNGVDNAANFFKLALVKLERGSVATPYPVELEADVLARCQRYYCKTFSQGQAPVDAGGVFTGALVMTKEVANSSSTSGQSFQFPVEMRTGGTITFYTPRSSGTANAWTNGSSEIVAAATYTGSRNSMIYSTSATISVARYYTHVTVDAEL